MDDSYVYCCYEAVFPQSLRHFQHTFANTEQDAVCHCCKIPCLDFGARHENFVAVRRHLQNGVNFVDPLQGQTDDSRRVPDVGCEQDGEEQSIPLL
jgi:hypothetical protein